MDTGRRLAKIIELMAGRYEPCPMQLFNDSIDRYEGMLVLK